MSDDVSFQVKLDGTLYEFRPMRLTPLDTSAMRREVGMTMPQLFEAIQNAPDIDILAAIVWLARRTNGERMLKFATVAEAITYESQFELVDEDESQETEHPE